MRMWILKSGLCLWVVIAIGVLRSDGEPAAADAPASTIGIGPRIQFDSLAYDFGTVRAGTTVTHDFVFTNTGDATLEITGVQPGCHCTTVGEWTRRVDPGKSGVIPFQFDSTGFSGVIFRMPSITCNDKSHSMVRFQLHGTVNKAIEVSPPFVFLNIGPDDSQETNGVVHIINKLDQPLLLADPTSSERTFTAELKTNIPGKSYDVIVKTVPPLASGNNQALITLGTFSTNVQPILISAVATVQPLLAAVPPEITLPAGPLKTNKTISVFLANNSSHPLALSEPSVNAAGAVAKIIVSRHGENFTVGVEFATGFAATAGTPLELSIKTDNPRFPVVKIPIKQTPAPPAARP